MLLSESGSRKPEFVAKFRIFGVAARSGSVSVQSRACVNAFKLARACAISLPRSATCIRLRPPENGGILVTAKRKKKSIMASQDKRLLTPDGTVYIIKDGNCWPKHSSDDIASMMGSHNLEVLHRAEANAWVLEKISVGDGEVISTECERVGDDYAKQFLIRLKEIDPLLKYKLGKIHGEKSNPEPEEGAHGDGEIADDKPIQRVSVEWVKKLGQVRGELVKLAARKDNDPEQQSTLEDCIKEISAIEKLLECDKVNPWWLPAIAKSLQHIKRVLLRAGENAAAEKVSEWLEWLIHLPKA